MPIAAPSTTLATIQQKVRRLTRTPSTAQLSDDDLNQYINTFMVYDFPEHLRTWNFRQTFSWTCNPGQDTYPLNQKNQVSQNANSPLYNFNNRFITVHTPVYIAGYNSFYSQSREQFFAIYPLTNSIQSTNQTGDGIVTNFAGTLPILNVSPLLPNPSTPNPGATFLQNNVLFDSIDSYGNGLQLKDLPILDAFTGNPTTYGQMYDPYAPPANYPNNLILSSPYPSQSGFPSTNFINYQTGQYNVTFTQAPGAGRIVNTQTIPQILSMPQSLLHYNDTFVLRPVPDQPYTISIEVYVRPTYFMEVGETPYLNEYWQYIAYGAARKILQDRLDNDTLALLEPEYRKQEVLVLRRTIVQYTGERTSTIYTEQTQAGGASGGWGWTGSSF